MTRAKTTDRWKSLRYILPALPLLLVALPGLAQAATDAMGHPLGQPYDWEIALQPAASPMKQRMIDFHDNILMPLITIISAFVMILLIWVMIRYNAKANPVPSRTTHNWMLELIWSIVPSVIVIWIMFESMPILYYVDRTHDAELTLNVTGYQWYWGYDYPDNNVHFMSNWVADKDLKPGQPRLLTVDTPAVLPVDTNIRLIIKAQDVIHSWSVPAFGVKMDAVPGHVNETWVRIDKPGTYYGQCSQLCGQGHGYMPIQVEAVSKEDFNKWVLSQPGGKLASAAPAGATAVASAAPAPAAAAADDHKNKNHKKAKAKAAGDE